MLSTAFWKPRGSSVKLLRSRTRRNRNSMPDILILPLPAPPENRAFALYYVFQEPFKSHVGKKAIQGSFDSFWFWPRKWNYWENPTFYKMLLLEGLLSGFNTIISLLGNTKWGEEKINFRAGTSWVGLYRFDLSIRMRHQGFATGSLSLS